MSNLDTLRNELVNEFYDNTTILNVSMNIEYFLCEEALIYPYRNWSLGEIIAGPSVKKYDVVVVLRYEYEEMPDPEAALVLKRFGVKVGYKKIKETVVDEKQSKDQNKIVKVQKEAWYVILTIPRELITDENQMKQLDALDRMVDLEALETAISDNMEEDSNFELDGGGDFGDDPLGGEDPMADEDIDLDQADEEAP